MTDLNLASVHEALGAFQRSRRTILCSAANRPAVQAAIDQHPFPGLYDIVIDPNVGDDQVFVLATSLIC